GGRGTDHPPWPHHPGGRGHPAASRAGAHRADPCSGHCGSSCGRSGSGSLDPGPDPRSPALPSPGPVHGTGLHPRPAGHDQHRGPLPAQYRRHHSARPGTGLRPHTTLGGGDPVTLLLLAASITILLLLRVPVAFAFLGPSLVYMLLDGQSSGMSLRQVTAAAQSFPLLAVPLFIFLGALANHAGIADRLFNFAMAMLARVRGNLGYVTVGVSVGFSWMSGSAVADAAALGKVQIPTMVRNAYSRRFATGISSTSSLIAPVMPPSIPAVICAGLAATSTGALFAAAVVPALLVALGLCVVVWLMLKREPNISRETFDLATLISPSKGILLP